MLNIRKMFGGLVALDSATMKVRSGSVHGLVGENGAGKSTLIKVLAGVFRPDEGQIILEGKPVIFNDPMHARDAGVAVIYQEPTLFPDLTISENVFMGRHPINSRTRRIQWRVLHRHVRDLLKEVGLDLDPRERLRGLSVADQQLVEVAKALSLNARVMVMDEPTASLTPTEVERLFSIVHRLQERDVAVVFIGHRLEEIFAVCDQITVLRDGSTVGTSDVLPAPPLKGPWVAPVMRIVIGRKGEAAAERMAEGTAAASAVSVTRGPIRPAPAAAPATPAPAASNCLLVSPRSVPFSWLLLISLMDVLSAEFNRGATGNEVSKLGRRSGCDIW